MQGNLCSFSAFRAYNVQKKGFPRAREGEFRVIFFGKEASTKVPQTASHRLVDMT